MEVIKLEQNNNGELCATSLEIARVTGKEHSKVLRDIREEMGEAKIGLGSYIDKQGKARPMYNLNERCTLQLMSRYSKKVRDMVFDEFYRMKEYIKNQQQSKQDLSTLDVLKLATAEIEKLSEENKKLIDRNKEVSETLLVFQKDGTALCVRDFVKYIYSENNIKITQKEVWELIDSKYVYKKKVGSKYQRMPKAQYQQYFEFKNITINEKVHRDFMISRKGVLYFANKITKMQKENETLVI